MPRCGSSTPTAGPSRGRSSGDAKRAKGLTEIRIISCGFSGETGAVVRESGRNRALSTRSGRRVDGAMRACRSFKSGRRSPGLRLKLRHRRDARMTRFTGLYAALPELTWLYRFTPRAKRTQRARRQPPGDCATLRLGARRRQLCDQNSPGDPSAQMCGNVHKCARMFIPNANMQSEPNPGERLPVVARRETGYHPPRNGNGVSGGKANGTDRP